MTRDEIIERMNWLPSASHAMSDVLDRIEKIVRAAEREARDQALTITQDEIAQGVADRDAERAELRAEIMANLRLNGWRQCAVGQKTTQFCGMLEAAVQAEREASFLRGYAAAIRFARGA
jgi:hypothetical protein